MQSRNNEVCCPNCQLLSEVPMLYCMRCGYQLFTNVVADGVQIMLWFEGGMRHSIAVFRQGQPIRIKQAEIRGPKVLLILEDDSVEKPTRELFGLLCRKEELWDIKQQFTGG